MAAARPLLPHGAVNSPVTAAPPARLSRRAVQARAAATRQLFFVKQRLFAAASFLLLDNMASGRARAALLRWCGAGVGRHCFLRGGLMIQEGFANIQIGDSVFINAGCCLDASAPIQLGDRVQLAFQVTLVTGGHEIGPASTRAGRHAPAPIAVGEGAWVGARALVLPGVTIGPGAVVAAGSVVTRDVPANTLVAGIPARPLRKLPMDAAEHDQREAADATEATIQYDI